MGRRMAGTKEIPPALKRDMNDFFVGLMGRRNTELGPAGPFNLGRDVEHSQKAMAAPPKLRTFPNTPLSLLYKIEN
ncbi:tachykinin-3a [Chiloscyllium plagiosum]|uniref:tachykinin-3a n=1 Tax=Chiloscyllium plagiosum TaxID=36176 RepID=UPI001CB7E4CC|nr:tachykinin-3a [Chiloscyllium plagiosum]